MKQLAIITGGSRGLGAALVSAYADAGWNVLELSRTGAAARAGVESVRLDLADPVAARAQVQALVRERVTPDLERVHFVNNAAMLGPVGATTLDGPDGWSTNIDVNIGAGIGVMSAFLAAVREVACSKVLVNISSGAATSAIRGWALYCASKAALEHWIRTVALEEADFEHATIAINVAPGVVDTGMQAEIRSAGPERFPDHARFVELKESGNLRSAADVASDFVALLGVSAPASDAPDSGESYRL